MSLTPEVRAAYDHAAAVATAVRQYATPAAMSVLEDLDREQLIHLSLALSSMVRQVFAEYCAQAELDTEEAWSFWLMACATHWDRA